MYTLVFFAPLFMFFLLFGLGRFLGGYYAALALSISTFAAWLLCFDALVTILQHSFFLTYYLPFTPLFLVGWFETFWHFGLDYLTLSMFFLITLVSFFIQLFATAYMGEDASQVRFMVYLSFFMIAMILLVGASNFLQLFFGWELVGLASFLLINFWFSRQDANAAAFKAMAVNRVGDCFLLLALLLFAFQASSFDFDTIFCLSLVRADQPIFIAAFFCLVMGAFAKSAQFFFHTWLPDAMEGPTPVSALLHSATMVTAGVFLVLRFIDLLEVIPSVRYLVVFVGLLTAFYAIAIAAVADDTKRVTAYTTLNQLGFMLYGCGSLATATVLFHLIVHGFYKSFSFLVAAAELHDFEDEQDGESDQLDPVQTNSIYDILATLVFFSVNAIPFTSPSISKEFLLLAGLERMPDYFTYLVSIVLFSAVVDEGRDDLEADFQETSYYQDELYSPSTLPGFMLAGCTGLGISSLASATFLEEFFLDMNGAVADTAFFWLDIRGTILLVLPFLSLVLADIDQVRRPILADVGQTTLTTRADSRYQTIIFNSELWGYDELITRLANRFYSFAYWHSNLAVDKGFLEQLYITGPTILINTAYRRFSAVMYLTLERLLIVPLFVLLVIFLIVINYSVLFFTCTLFTSFIFFSGLFTNTNRLSLEKGCP
jgi:NADH:ubiquinone oxidoreductase subunit 5 (subunit L)/multisubunit Na+/H+ antiporter MnhA subunit